MAKRRLRGRQESPADEAWVILVVERLCQRLAAMDRSEYGDPTGFLFHSGQRWPISYLHA